MLQWNRHEGNLYFEDRYEIFKPQIAVVVLGIPHHYQGHVSVKHRPSQLNVFLMTLKK